MTKNPKYSEIDFQETRQIILNQFSNGTRLFSRLISKVIRNTNQMMKVRMGSNSTIKLSINQYVEMYGVCDSTVRNSIKNGKLNATKENGKWYIVINKEELPSPVSSDDNQDNTIPLLKQQVEHLQNTVEILKERIKEADVRSERQDQIIMRQTLMLGSDSKGGIWQRIKNSIFGNVQSA